MDTTTGLPPAWPTEWLRGALSVSVLHVVAGGATYGYAIATALTRAGFGPIKGGTLYPLLSRLEEAGLVGVEWRAGDGGPGRKFYALTESGRAEHERQIADWLRFTALTRTFVTTPTTSEEDQS